MCFLLMQLWLGVCVLCVNQNHRLISMLNVDCYKRIINKKKFIENKN